MDNIEWKIKRTNEILGIPDLDTRYLPPHVLITMKEQLSKIDEVGAIILFGSVVRGESSPKSDIDLAIIPTTKETNKNFERKITDILNNIEKKYNMETSFSLIIYTGEEDSYFIWEMMKDGIVIYSKPEMAIKSIQNLKPYGLISYTYSGLKETEKKRIQRFLFESKNGIKVNRKNKMEYIAPGVILLSADKLKKTIKFFEEHKLKHSLIKIWR